MLTVYGNFYNQITKTQDCQLGVASAVLDVGCPTIIKTIFGDCIVQEPVLCELINTRAMQRLKKIQQYGFVYYTDRRYDYSRFDHSVGVLHLLMNVGVSIEEQIAGLLHDVSHTAFSHVADVLFVHKSLENSYQDDIHAWYIKQTDIPAVLHTFGFSTDQILHKNGCFMALEQKLPALCADRIEYLLHGALVEHLITADQIKAIVKDLHFDGKSWYFDSLESARIIADISLLLNEFTFAADWDIACNQWGAQALQRALDCNIITLQEIHFSCDEIIWQKLEQSHDAIIQACLKKIKNPLMFFARSTVDFADLASKPKFRGVNPWVKVNDDQYALLSELDADFHYRFLRLQKTLDDGICLKFL